jgi:hypothetical protein
MVLGWGRTLIKAPAFYLRPVSEMISAFLSVKKVFHVREC